MNILMKFILDFQKTPLCIAVEKQNVEIIQLLLANEKIDVNLPYILKLFNLIK